MAMNHNPDSRIHILWCQIYAEWDYPHAVAKYRHYSREEPKRGWLWWQSGDPFNLLKDERVTRIRFETLEAFPLTRTTVRGQKLESMLRKLLNHIRRENSKCPEVSAE